MLGTRCGKVLATGVVVSSNAASGSPPRVFNSPSLSEFGRVDGGCWRVQCAPVLDQHAEAILVIDSAGQAHELHGIDSASARGPHRRKKQRVASRGSCGSGGGSSSGGGIAETKPGPVERSSSMYLPPRQLRVAPPFAKCSSVLVSPAAEGTCLSWAENGSPGKGNDEAYVAVASDGCVLSSARARVGETVELQRGTGDGVVHASASFYGGAYGLLLVDGGASLVTHGNGRTGHVSSEQLPLLMLAAFVGGVLFVVLLRGFFVRVERAELAGCEKPLQPP